MEQTTDGAKRPVKYRTPTNEDAKSLPTVEVRPDESYEWKEVILLAVVESLPRFCVMRQNGSQARYNICRMEEKPTNESMKCDK